MRSMLIAVALVFASALTIIPQPSANAEHRCTSAACREAETGRPDLFRNYYLDPTCGGVGAQMYTAPHPVPAYVGQTFFTYQPLMPHEFLYKHHRSYHRYYNEGRGLTRTSVRWR